MWRPKTALVTWQSITWCCWEWSCDCSREIRRLRNLVINTYLAAFMLLFIVTGVLETVALLVTVVGATQSPNIVVILADDLVRFPYRFPRGSIFSSPYSMHDELLPSRTPVSVRSKTILRSPILTDLINQFILTSSIIRAIPGVGDL